MSVTRIGLIVIPISTVVACGLLSKHNRKKNKLNNNNRILIVGPSFSGKTYLKMGKLKHMSASRSIGSANIFDGDILTITRSPEQYNDEINTEIRDISDIEGSFVVFDDMLNYKHRAANPLFTRGRHKDLDVYYLSESYFWFTRKNNKK